MTPTLISNRYRLTRTLGQGGMGTVYEAYDEVLGRAVALKMVRSGLVGDDSFRVRLQREASTLAKIRSRHIVTVHELGEADGQLFIVTDLFPDGDLYSLLRQRGPVAPHDAIRICADICEALTDAREAHVIHRDVKPANVLLWQRKQGLVAYLADFGIATVNDQPGLTRPGTVLGSPAFMAPERHTAGHADHQGDVYSVGCLLWACLSGRAPYSGTDYQVITGHLTGAIPQLPGNSDISSALNSILSGSMAKSPQDRLKSSIDMKELLDAASDAPRRVAEPFEVVAGTDVDTVLQDRGDDGFTVLGAEFQHDWERVEDSRSQSDRVNGDDQFKHPNTASETPNPHDGRTQEETAAGPPTSQTNEERDEAKTIDVVSQTLSRSPGPTHARTDIATQFHGPLPERVVAWRPRRRLLIALIALGVAACVAALMVGGAVHRGTSSAVDVGTRQKASHDNQSSSPTSVTPAAPAAPQVVAKPAYRSVVFAVRRAAPDVGGSKISYQVWDGAQWNDLGGAARAVQPTAQGGDEACVKIRAIATPATGEAIDGAMTTWCGRSEARSVRLVRTDDRCPNASDCRWYDVEVSGFKPGGNPVAYIYLPDGSPWCSCSFNPVHIDKDGRGAQIHEWQVVPDRIHASVTLVVDGVKSRVFVP